MNPAGAYWHTLPAGKGFESRRTREKPMTTRTSKDRADVRILDAAELDTVTGGSLFDAVIEAWDHTIISPRDATSGLATGRRVHKPISFVTP